MYIRLFYVISYCSAIKDTKMRAKHSAHPSLRHNSTVNTRVVSSTENSCRGTVIKFSVVFRSASSPNREAAIILAPRFASSIIRRWGALQRWRAPTRARALAKEKEKERERMHTDVHRHTAAKNKAGGK